MFKFKCELEIRLLVTLTRVFAFTALIVGSCYGFTFKDPVVMITSITSALGLFALNSNNKSKEKQDAQVNI